MRRNPDYVLKYVCGVPYLLVTGTESNVGRRSHRLNATGEAIWRLIDGEVSSEELLGRCYEFFECENEDERKIIEREVLSFIEKLEGINALAGYEMGKLEREARDFEMTDCCADVTLTEGFIREIRVAEIGLSFYGDEKVLPENFEAFSGDNKAVKAKMTVQLLCEGDTDETSEERLVRFGSLCLPFTMGQGVGICKAKSGYVFLFNSYSNVKWMYVSKDGSYAEIFYAEGDIATTRYEMYESTRLAFSYLALLNNAFLLHAASVIDEGKAVLFSAYSGVGKSTHAGLWEREFGDRIFNGDLALLTEEKGRYFVWGLPWCGTSETYGDGRYELKSIVLLQQASTNHTEEMNSEKKTIHILNRLISPNWDSEQIDCLLSFAGKVAAASDIFKMYCNMEPEAAKVCRARAEQGPA